MKTNVREISVKTGALNALTFCKKVEIFSSVFNMIMLAEASNCVFMSVPIEVPFAKISVMIEFSLGNVVFVTFPISCVRNRLVLLTARDALSLEVVIRRTQRDASVLMQSSPLP